MTTNKELIEILRGYAYPAPLIKVDDDCRIQKSILIEVADRLEMLTAEENRTVVVRCKNCKFSKWNEKKKQRYCGRKWAMYRTRERDYCSYGVSKD